MNWNDPLDPVAVTVSEIACGERPALRVVHQSGHGGWQFYDGHPIGERTPTIIPKEDLLVSDPTLETVLDLPVGWQAERSGVGSEWARRPLEEERV